MPTFIDLLVHLLASLFRSRASLVAEITLLRHQLNVLRRRAPVRSRLTAIDRWLFVWLYRLKPSLLDAVVIVKPDTLVR